MEKKEGCELCGRESYRLKRGYSTDKVIEEFKKIHGDYYDYSKANYINTDTKIEIICPKHGSFFQTPYVAFFLPLHYKFNSSAILEY